MLHDRIQGLIFDLDNTLYPFPENKDEIYARATAKSAIKLGFPGNLDEALTLAAQSWKEHQSELVVFSKEYGISETAMIKELHDIGSVAMAAAITPDSGLKSAFSRLATSHSVTILTHGSQLWAERLTKHLGYSPNLQKQNSILGIDNALINYQRKDSCTSLFTKVAGLMHLPTANIAVVEDTTDNLKIPHALGMQTVYVNWGRPLKTLPEHVHTQVKTIKELTSLKMG